MNLRDELESRYERNEVAFEQGRIAERYYLQNAMFFQEVARVIEKTRELELNAVDLEGETFIKSLIRELSDYNLVLTLTTQGEARISAKSAETKVVEMLKNKRDWVHEMLLTTAIEDAQPVLERLTGINRIAQKTEHNANYYAING